MFESRICCFCACVFCFCCLGCPAPQSAASKMPNADITSNDTTSTEHQSVVESSTIPTLLDCIQAMTSEGMYAVNRQFQFFSNPIWKLKVFEYNEREVGYLMNDQSKDTYVTYIGGDPSKSNCVLSMNQDLSFGVTSANGDIYSQVNGESPNEIKAQVDILSNTKELKQSDEQDQRGRYTLKFNLKGAQLTFEYASQADYEQGKLPTSISAAVIPYPIKK